MLHFISWSDFLEFLAIAITFYYLLVLALYFKKEILTLLRFQGKPTHLSFNATAKENKQEGQATIQNEKPGETEDFSSSPVEILLELKDLFQRAARQDFGKPELIQAIRSILKKDPTLAKNKLREDINIHITEESRLQCGVDLSPEDLAQVWGP